MMFEAKPAVGYAEKTHGLLLMERPLFSPLFSMIAGLSAASMLNRFVPETIVFPLLVLALCTVFRKGRALFLVSISCLMFCAANLSLKPYLLPNLPSNHIAGFCSDVPVIVEGVIDSRPEATESGFRLYLQTELVRKEGEYRAATGRLALTVRGGEAHFVTGDRIRFASRIRKPRNYGIPGEFDIERFMAFRRVSAMAFVKDPDDIVFIDRSGEFPLERRIDEIALHLGRYISGNLPATEGAILRALLLGEMGSVPKTMKDAYTMAGVNHILSISGFHVGIIALFLCQVLLLTAKGSEFLLLRLNMRRFSLVATLPVVVFYMFLSGAAPATIRSVIMIGMFILAMVLERETDPVDTLMLAAVVILAAYPPELFDISFQLSFLAIWGIVVLTPIFYSPFKAVRGKAAGRLLLFLAASGAAIASTVIPVAYYFHRTSLTGLISNFLIVPLLGYGAVVLGFSALPFVYIAPPAAKALFWAAGYLVKLSDAVILLLAKIPALPPFSPSRFHLAFFFFFMVAITFVKAGKARRLCCISVSVIFLFLWITQGPRDKGKLVFTFFSIGQGESILVDFPDGKHMLIDGGGSPGEHAWDTGERLIAPALWKMGIDKVDYLVLSHPHPDHLLGLNYGASNFEIGEFWEGGSYPECKEYLELMEILKKRGIPVRLISAESAPVDIGGARVEPLAPFPRNGSEAPSDYSDQNDESLVFRVKLGKFAVLLTGDIGSGVEERLALHPDLLRCTILKVPHHGSGYSSSLPFVTAASPKIAVISAGYGNSFHLPAQRTLDRLRGLGIELYRTDLDGTVRAVCENPVENFVTVRKTGHFH